MQRRIRNEIQVDQGMTVVEVIVILFILLLLGALLFPSLEQSRGPARKSHCLNNLRNLGIAVTNYVSQYGGVHPAGWTGLDGIAEVPEGAHGMSMFVSVLNHIDRGSLYRKLSGGSSSGEHFTKSTDAELWQTNIALFRCPEHGLEKPTVVIDSKGNTFKLSTLSYGGNFGSTIKDTNGVAGPALKDYYTSAAPEVNMLKGNGLFSMNSQITIDEVMKQDGASCTLMLGEFTDREINIAGDGQAEEHYVGTWVGYLPDTVVPPARFLRDVSAPLDSQENDFGYSSKHVGGAFNVIFADGRAKSVSSNTDFEVMQKMACRNDGDRDFEQ